MDREYLMWPGTHVNIQLPVENHSFSIHVGNHQPYTSIDLELEREPEMNELLSSSSMDWWFYCPLTAHWTATFTHKIHFVQSILHSLSARLESLSHQSSWTAPVHHRTEGLNGSAPIGGCLLLPDYRLQFRLLKAIAFSLFACRIQRPGDLKSFREEWSPKGKQNSGLHTNNFESCMNGKCKALYWRHLLIL